MQKLSLIYKNIKRCTGLSYKWMPLYTVMLLALSIAIALIPIVQAKVTGNIVNSITDSVSKGEGIRTVLFLIFLYVLIRLVSDLISSVNTFFDKRWWNKFSNDQEIFEMESMSKLEPGHLEDPEFKALLSTVKFKGFWSVISLTYAQFTSLPNLVVLLATSIIIFRVNPYIVPILIVATSFEFYLQLRYNKHIWMIWQEGGDKMKAYAHLKENVTQKVSVTQNRLLKSLDFVVNRARGILDAFNKEQKKADWEKIVRSFLAHGLASLGFGFSFYLIINQVFTGKINVGEMVFYLAVLSQYTGTIDQFFNSISRQYKDALEVNDIFKIVDVTPFLKEIAHPAKLALESAPSIEFKNVSFSYANKDAKILDNFNLKIEAGEKVALVGNNGAGKTTLIKLLCRFYDPTEGQILINGIDLKDLSKAEWYGYLALLFQDYSAYSFTAKESVAMGRVEEAVNIDKVKTAAVHSGADEFISEWKNQYDEQLGSEFNGIAPSQGQEQKIAIARALYRGGYVLVLDEPTASVDALSEADIFEKIRTSTENRTLILISHRFNTVINMDRIIVIEQGKVVEEGSHAKLMKKKAGVYAKMFNSQASGYVSA